MAAKFVDFDQMIAEMRRERITFRVFGEDVSFPAQVPALVVLQLMRIPDGEGVPPEVLMYAAGQIFGAEVLEKWTNRSDFSMDMLAELLKAALRLINGDVLDERLSVTEDDVENGRKN